MSETRGAVSQGAETGSYMWMDLSKRAQYAIGLQSGLAAFFMAVTFAWNHAAWHWYLLTPLLSCLAAGFLTAGLLANRPWRAAVMISIICGVVVLIVSALLLFAPPTMSVVSVFAVILAAVLTLPYILKGDLGDASVFNLRVYSVLAIVSIIVFSLNDAGLAAARTPLNILFTLVLSAGLVIYQLAIARHVQAKMTMLSQNSMLYSGVGVLTLTALIGAIGPIAAIAIAFGACILLSLIFVPLITPLVNALHFARSPLHYTQSGQTSLQSNHDMNQIPPLPHATEIKWIT